MELDDEQTGATILRRALEEPMRGIVENAASIAAMILTTEALVTDIPEEEKAPAMPPTPPMY
jgi:chaperonin GroEL (HSP60 family)